MRENLINQLSLKTKRKHQNAVNISTKNTRSQLNQNVIK